MSDADEESTRPGPEAGTERISSYESPEWRRRTRSIEIERSGDLLLEAVIVSKRWAPPKVVKLLVGAAPGYWLERALRRVAGRVRRARGPAR